jgi:hypothetical protein
MSKLNVDQKTIKDLFQSKKSDFLIPDYQRPYAWGEAECRTLWDDIFSFAIPDEGKTEFDSNSEYFLGPIVTFRNEDKLEVIDGQQRLTTLMLLLRAFYSKFGHMQDKASISTKQNIEKCLWKTDEFGEPDMSQLKIDSEVATDNDKEEFLEILRTGIVNKEMKSKYACNFRFFQNNIDEFLSKYPTYFAYLPTSFKVQTEVSASPTFFGWVFGFNGKVQILAPESVKEQYRQMIAKADEDMQESE